MWMFVLSFLLLLSPRHLASCRTKKLERKTVIGQVGCSQSQKWSKYRIHYFSTKTWTIYGFFFISFQHFKSNFEPMLHGKVVTLWIHILYRRKNKRLLYTFQLLRFTVTMCTSILKLVNVCVAAARCTERFHGRCCCLNIVSEQQVEIKSKY